MRMRECLGLLLAFVLAACSAPTPTSPQQGPQAAGDPGRRLLDYPGQYGGGYYGRSNVLPGGDRETLYPVSVSASSNYSNTEPFEAVDGNTDTQWASGGYQDRRAFFVMQFAQSVYVSTIMIKTGPTNGSRYRVELSQDGINWVVATDWLENYSWYMERKPVRAHGRFLRIRWRNSPWNPQARFAIFEIRAYGGINVLPYGQPVAQGYTGGQGYSDGQGYPGGQGYPD